MSPFSALPPSMGIIVVPARDDGSGSTASTGVSNTQGPSREGRSNSSRAGIMEFINFFMRNRLIQLVILWMTFIFPRLRRATANIMQEITPTMGLAFIAVSIQNIIQIAFSQGSTLPKKSLQQVNGVAVVLLLYGLLTPNYAGGRFVMAIGVILVAGSAVAVAFI
ncbi:uncharacterized protein LOC141644050 isoform X1 [Silene latifolia]|uniref:uncharacterized protein LOC141644050 isoform X1 n=1 Tax=Silene latifolia TaxID=37657 RepID=UPI003D78A2CE